MSDEQLVGALDVDREVRQVAVVDAEDVGLDVERHLQLALAVDLHERVEVERPRLAQQLEEVVGIERGDDQQDRVGPRGRRLVELVGVDDEVLAQHRQVASRPARARRSSSEPPKWNGSVRIDSAAAPPRS